MERLKKNSQFLRVKNLGVSVREKPFWLQVCLAEEETSSFGVIATKRLGGAVRRNKAKRIVRMLCTNPNLYININRPLDIVVLPRTGLFETSFFFLEKIFTDALSKAFIRL